MQNGARYALGTHQHQPPGSKIVPRYSVGAGTFLRPHFGDLGKRHAGTPKIGAGTKIVPESGNYLEGAQAITTCDIVRPRPSTDRADFGAEK